MTTFPSRQAHFQQLADKAQQQYNQLAILRLAWFFGVLAGVFFLYKIGQYGLAVGLGSAGLIGFAVLLKWHQRIRRERDLNRQLVFINEDEQARLDRTYLRPETGLAFAPPDHAYAQDLDVFGKHSLFKLLNRTHTHDGSARLAHYLLHPALPATVMLRQEAAAALKPHLDWRQQAEALARLNERVAEPTEGLREWTNTPTPLPAWVDPVRFLFPLITLGVIVAWLSGYLPGLAVIGCLAVHGLVLGQISKLALLVGEQTYNVTQTLLAYTDLLRHAEQMPGDTRMLQDLRRRLTTDAGTASGAIAHLARLVENLNFRKNIYFALFVGLPVLWDLHYLQALNRWKVRYGPFLADWLSVEAEIEAINSLAGFAYAHPGYAKPELVEDNGIHVEGTAIAHPLLSPTRAIANTLSLIGSGKTVLITGSNMSGKSTFLRTLGLNVVLAQAGAVTSAVRFACSPLQVYTSMRTQDSLEENTSSFYAELKRLRTLIRLAKPNNDPGQLPVLYFLDEILKGTNSADRHKGAEALIRQLHRTAASGFVSTHDVELGSMANADDFVANYHFRSDIDAGQVTFDYHLRPGVCKSFNASQLMQAMGIEV
ncbi:DNA mismatch repair protein MutS [Fibrella sp. HMF5335]|uniref:DNA mismatch repair protein MutS n=1 Tax=Fibrella rubiginis TaxID=2817060 RepID=A0A939K558_9BACT|nr:DNA mismatch repair protein MutS [Fibrella rubiginis]MBO0937403.1 DNA mismatch repair protein MutS [Fibrella rubiginis]